MEHKLDSYQDGAHNRVTFCRICGHENPVGDCPGPEQTKIADRKILEKEPFVSGIYKDKT